MRRAVIVSFVVLAAACSSEEQLNPQPLPPGDPERSDSPSPGPAVGGTCSGTCCSLPAEGSACDATTDTTCTWAVTCPTGLVIGHEVTCENGAWKVTNDCPKEGETDARGCPASQPPKDAPCDAKSVTGQCGYVLECTGYRKSAQATCTYGQSTANGTTWQTTPLGTCD